MDSEMGAQHIVVGGVADGVSKEGLETGERSSMASPVSSHRWFVPPVGDDESGFCKNVKLSGKTTLFSDVFGLHVCVMCARRYDSWNLRSRVKTTPPPSHIIITTKLLEENLAALQYPKLFRWKPVLDK